MKKKKIAVLSVTFFTFPLLLSLFFKTWREKDSSQLKRVLVPMQESQSSPTQKNQERWGGIGKKKRKREILPKKKTLKKKVIYRARQIVEREFFRENSGIPLSARIKGRLLSFLDTRNLTPQRVFLEEEVKNAKGVTLLPKGSVLMGQAQYPGQGKRVFLSFGSALLPDSRKFFLSAQILDPEDYSLGLKGELHSNAAHRVASTLGLHMLSGATQTMVEKESLGQSTRPTPKSYLRNALLNGISMATREEAHRKARQMSQRPEYVFLRAGREVVVSFLSFSGEGK